MNSTTTRRLDPLQAVIGLFVFLGVALTAVAGYAMVDTFGVTFTPDLAVAVLSAVSLAAFLAVTSSWFREDVGRRRA